MVTFGYNPKFTGLPAVTMNQYHVAFLVRGPLLLMDLHPAVKMCKWFRLIMTGFGREELTCTPLPNVVAYHTDW